MRKEKIYALYKGEEFLTEGTAKEIAEEMGIHINTLYYYATSYYRRRLSKRKVKNARIAILLEEE